LLLNAIGGRSKEKAYRSNVGVGEVGGVGVGEQAEIVLDLENALGGLVDDGPDFGVLLGEGVQIVGERVVLDIRQPHMHVC
jgi:hypothetical protein